MNDTAITEAARLLWTHWQAGTALGTLPAECRPQTRAEGYSVQSRLETLSGRQRFGWKIAATSAVGQAHINVSGPLAGRLLTGQVHGPGASLSLQGNRMRVAEPEMAFCMGQDLAPRGRPYDTAEVLAAVATLHPSLEVPDSRFAEFTGAGEAQLLADNACAHQFVLGPAAVDNWRTLDLGAHPVHAEVTSPQGQRWTREGTGAAVLGDPRLALTWLVNELTALGLTLHAGEYVTTGTCMAPLELTPGDVVAADFGALGPVTLRVC